MSKKTMAIARATAVIGATAALIVGVTFASLTSSATLQNNTLASATAGLLLWNGSSFASTATGFTVSGFVPGTGSADLPFYFQNSGGVPLNLTVQSTIPASATGFTGWENLKVTIKNDAAGGPGVTVTNMAALMAGPVALNGGALANGATGDSNTANTPGNFHISFDIAPGSITGSQATVGSFDLTFTGTQPAS